MEPPGMCGRFTQTFTWDELQEFYALVNELAPNLKPSWNVAPTQEIGVIGARDGGTPAHQSERRVQPEVGKIDAEQRTAATGPEQSERAIALGFTRMRWGLVPSWAKDASSGAKMINARSDTIAEKPAFREAFRKRRCVIPVSGFFEWQGSGSGKTPWFITSVSGEPLSFAGLWERWRDGEGQLLRTATIITTDANEALASLHHRMPVILARADVEAWLAEGDARLLRPCPDAWLTRWPVSPRVNSVRNDAADLIEAVPASTLL
jgi:putative SOS response-associated peptidase YedK